MTDAERLADIREKMHEWSAKDIDNDTWHEWVGDLFADHLAAARAEGYAAGVGAAAGVIDNQVKAITNADDSAAAIYRARPYQNLADAIRALAARPAGGGA